ncbi:O-methyltransferase [bacterium]|nr:O-methyltransferase [bacterium]
MQRWPDEVYQYIEQHTRFGDPLLAEMEERAAREDFPIIGPLVGPWLYFFTRLIGARRVFELGSGFGYSTWYFAKAVADNAASANEPASNGLVTHTVWDENLSAAAQENMARAGLTHVCEFILGEAVEALRKVEPGIDIIFMDINKEGYPAAIPVIEEKLRRGGLLLVDNVIWSGAVTDPSDQRESTRAIREMMGMLSASASWQLLVNPLRDGVAVARLEVTPGG